MGIIFRQGSIGSILYYLRALIISINVLWLFPNILSTEQIGLYKLILSAVTLLSSIAQLGISQSIIKFFPNERNEKASFFGFITVTSLLGFFLILLVLFLFKNKIDFYFQKNVKKLFLYYPLIICTSLTILFSTILKAWFRSLLRTLFPTLVQNVVIFFLMSVSALLYYFKIITFETLLLGIFIIYFFGFFLMLYYLIYIQEFKISFNFRNLNKKFIKKFLIYNTYTLSGNNGFTLVTKLDSIMISSLIGLKANGIYATVILFGKLIEIPRRAVKQIAVPILSKLLSNKDYHKINNTYKKISLNQVLVGGLIFLIIYTNIDSILLITNNKEYTTGKTVVIFISITKLLDALFSIATDIIIMSKYFRFNIVSLVLLFSTTIISNYLMIPKFGITGAAAATAISYFIYNLSTSLYIFIKFKMHPFTTNIFFIPLIMFSTYLITNFIININNIFLLIATKSIITILVYISLCLIFKVSIDLNNFFKILNAKKI